MTLFKRIFFFLFINLLIVLTISIVSFFIEHFFGIRLGSALSGGYGTLAIYSVIVGFSGSFISLLLSRWTAKRIYGIDPIREERLLDYSRKEQLLFTIVARLAKAHNIDMPEVGVYDASELNAFATGASKNSALVAASSGLLLGMDDEEIEWVIGHEMAHVLNGDMVTMTLLQGVLNTFVIFASRVVGTIVDAALSSKSSDSNSSGSSGFMYYVCVWIFELFFGILASILLMAFSRHREYGADEGSARMLGKARMIKALKRLASERPREDSLEDDKLAAFKISSSKSSWLSLFSTHPNISDRIKKLEENYLLP